MFRKLKNLKDRYDALSREMADPSVAADAKRLQEAAREQASLREVVSLYDRYEAARSHRAQAKEMLAAEKDAELRDLAAEDMVRLDAEMAAMEESLKIGLLPKDPDDDRNAYLEIRAGAGGDEASLFAGELLRAYMRWAETNKFKVESMSLSETEVGGVKEAVILIKGPEAFRHLKMEGGVHRVQRIPTTESGGRVHTSTVTVAAMPEVAVKDFVVDERDLRWDVFRASGAGGQHVNRTESAVRLTHLPTHVVVSMQDERSQLKNREKAMKILVARLRALDEQQKADANAKERRDQVGSGDRSEKIRTYNYPQNRVTDHRLGWSSHNLDSVMNGELGAFIDRLLAMDQAEKLSALALS